VLFTICDSESVFMQDGASCHKSRLTLKFLDQKSVCVIVDWPPQLPDLNLIENLRSIVKTKVGKRIFSDSEDVWSAVDEEWNGISADMIHSLYQSMPS